MVLPVRAVSGTRSIESMSERRAAFCSLLFALNGRNQVCGGRIIACSLIPLIRAIGKIRGHSDQRNPHSHWLTRGMESRSPEGSADFHIGDSPTRRTSQRPFGDGRYTRYTCGHFKIRLTDYSLPAPPF